jgi:ABC-type polysaccharide/polyol phosphate transport system ATPase subunit
MPLIEVSGVSKSFWIPSVRRETIREHVMGILQPRRFQPLTVLDDISLDVRAGEALGIMGRNGSGKSTLLKIMCGVFPPDKGRVNTRAEITPILELGLGWNPELDAVDNVFLIGSVMGLSLQQIRRSMDEILAFAELERFANQKLMHYSSGMSARLGYAVAFQAVREVLVLDEIFAVGDAGFRARCEERYRQLRASGHTVIMVSHDPRIISEFCDRAVLIDGGKVMMNGAASDVADRYMSMLAPASS